jgi:carbamoyl-phosphate synthase small subunit
MTKPTPVVITLESGFQCEGLGWGDWSQPRSAEIVFSTAMTGIEESLTDPSFCGQALVATVAHVGNTGFTGEDQESSKIWAEGLICRHLEHHPHHWRAKSSLTDWILAQGRFVVENVNTRALTVALREGGSQRGILSTRGFFESISSAQSYLRSKVAPMSGLDLTDAVTAETAWNFPVDSQFGYWPYAESLRTLTQRKERPRVAVWDFGVKSNTLRLLSAMGLEVSVYPARTQASEFMSPDIAGVLLSNGPGDPAAATHIVAELKKLVGRKPLFAICLGHQLVAIAMGAKTYKMKFGHRGIHHPVTEFDATGRSVRTWITSQNHGFAVDEDSLPPTAWVTHRHGDDQSVEGVCYPGFDFGCDTVQFHPEAAPGPMEAHVLLKNFVRTLEP